MGVSDERFSLFFLGVDIHHFRPGLPCEDLKQRIGLHPGERFVLSVGRLSRRKGFDMVIRSLPHVIKQGTPLRYVLIGIGEDQAYLAQLAKEKEKAEREQQHDHVSPEDLPRWYN